MMNTSSNSGSSRLVEDRLDCFLELGVGVLLRHSCKDDLLFLQICWHRGTNHKIKRQACKDEDKAEIVQLSLVHFILFFCAYIETILSDSDSI